MAPSPAMFLPFSPSAPPRSSAAVPNPTPLPRLLSPPPIQPKSSGSFGAIRRTPNLKAAAFSPTFTFSWSSRTSSNISCAGDKDVGGDFFEDFSVLPQDGSCRDVKVWSTMAAYFFSLHVPLSFGGLGAISQILGQPELDPLTKAISTLLLQITELGGASALLHYSTKGQQLGFASVLQDQNTSKRSWIKASFVALGFLFFSVLLTSYLADLLIGPKDVNDPALQEVLTSTPASKAVCFAIYCFVTPLLEETVFRGFLLRSLVSTMRWQQAVVTSACIFSLAHLSLENAPQLVFIGSVLGCVYCWTGSLVTSIVVHSVYNAAVLIITSSA